MNKKMRDLLTQIEAKRQEAENYANTKDTTKAATVLDEVDDLQAQFEVAKRLFAGEKDTVPDVPPQTQKKLDGFAVLAKMLTKKPLEETEKALVTGGNNGENYLMPEDVDLSIRELRKQYKAAKELVTVIPTDTMSGAFNFETDSAVGLSSLTDGDEADSSTEPKFERKAFAIKLFGKLIPVSKVLAGAEKSGLLAYINRWFVKNAIISENAAIFSALKKEKTAKALQGWKALKESINKDLDPAALIGGKIITNQSGFAVLDDAVDALGRPLLQQNPADMTQRLFQSLPVEVFSDKVLPSVEGKAPVFYGAIDAGCYFIEKGGLEFSASEHYLFGKNQNALLVIEGFDVIQADVDAYLYATLEPAAPEPAADI